MTDCILWKGAKHWKGYGSRHWKGRTRGAHRVAFEEQWGVSLPSRLHVLHECDNPPCVNPDHLFLGTNEDNRADSVQKQRHASGSRHGHAKLTEETAVYAMARLLTGESQLSVGNAFGVAGATIATLWQGRTWSALFAPSSDEEEGTDANEGQARSVNPQV